MRTARLGGKCRAGNPIVNDLPAGTVDTPPSTPLIDRACDGLVDEVVTVQRASLALVRRLAAAGHQRQVSAIEVGELAATQRWIR